MLMRSDVLKTHMDSSKQISLSYAYQISTRIIKASKYEQRMFGLETQGMSMQVLWKLLWQSQRKQSFLSLNMQE